jgi:hypothetical protein
MFSACNRDVNSPIRSAFKTILIHLNCMSLTLTVLEKIASQGLHRARKPLFLLDKDPETKLICIEDSIRVNGDPGLGITSWELQCVTLKTGNSDGPELKVLSQIPISKLLACFLHSKDHKNEGFNLC